MDERKALAPDWVLSQLPDVEPRPLYLLMEGAAKGYKQLCALAAAVHLRLFDCLDTPRTPDGLATQVGADPQLIKDICQLLTDMQLLSCDAKRFAATPLGQTYLNSKSPWFQGEVLKNLFSGFGLWQQLGRICTDGPVRVDEAVFFENNLVDSLASEILTGELQHTVNAIARQPEFASARKMLDLGGGHGLYTMALACQNTDIEAVVFDFKPVEKDFLRYKSRYGSNRVHFVPGNLFVDDLGDNFDLVLFSYNPGGKNERVLENIRRCLKRGGLFVTKHAFYSHGETVKSTLLDIEWQLTAFSGVAKGRHVYAFAQDMTAEAYMNRLRQDFDIIETISATEFATPPLSKFGDRLDSKIFICRKK